MRLFRNILRKFNKIEPQFLLKIDDQVKKLGTSLEIKKVSSELYDEIFFLESTDAKIKVTKRHIDNGDLFLYFEMKDIVKGKVTIELVEDFVHRLKFDMYYQKPEYDNRYGENKVTGPSCYIEMGNGSLMASKVYYYNRLRQEYFNEEYSVLYDLVSEVDGLNVDGNKLTYFLEPKAQECSFFILLSEYKLFDSNTSLESYIKDYFMNIKTNYVVSSFFVQPSGTYTKLPYSIEPFTKNGYGYSLHHSSKKELIPFLEQHGDRYFYDLLVNAVLQAKLYQKQDGGVYYTPFTSTWLKKDTGITAPYIDTRLNETYNLMLEDLYRITRNDLFKPGTNDYLDFLIRQKQTNNVYISETGSMFPDYFKEGLNNKTHVSLNHQLGIANLAYKQYKINEDSKYKELFFDIFNFLKDTTKSWIKENGDLYYGVTMKTGNYEFHGNDYVYVTLIDLLRMQINLLDCIGEKSTELTELINSKIKYLEENDYSIFKENSTLPMGESIKTKLEARKLYNQIYL